MDTPRGFFKATHYDETKVYQEGRCVKVWLEACEFVGEDGGRFYYVGGQNGEEFFTKEPLPEIPLTDGKLNQYLCTASKACLFRTWNLGCMVDHARAEDVRRIGEAR